MSGTKGRSMKTQIRFHSSEVVRCLTEVQGYPDYKDEFRFYVQESVQESHNRDGKFTQVLTAGPFLTFDEANIVRQANNGHSQ